MIIIFVLLWFSALWGMEQEKPAQLVQKKPAWIPPLLAIAQRAVCTYIIDKKITIEDVQQLLPHEQELIHSLIKSAPKEVKGGELYDLRTITPDHRYILVKSNQGLLRLDLCTNQTVKVDDSKEDILAKALSPSGNLVTLLSSEKIWIKDIAQNRLITEKTIKDVIGQQVFPVNIRTERERIFFIGERELLIFNLPILDEESDLLPVFLSIEKKLESPRYLKNRYIGMLPIAQEYITYTDGTCSKIRARDRGRLLFMDNLFMYRGGVFSRTTADGELKNETEVKNLFYISSQEPALYEPAMLIAYAQEILGHEGEIDVVSLKDWPAIVTPLSRVPFYGATRGKVGVFANKGQWLMIPGWTKEGWERWGMIPGCRAEFEFTIWDWQHNKRLYTYKSEHPIFHLSYTDNPTPYPCLFESNNILYTFDPIKAVAASMLSRAAAQKAEVISKDNNSNNNNNSVSNDNGPQPTPSMDRDK